VYLDLVRLAGGRGQAAFEGDGEGVQGRPKTDASMRTIALDAETVTTLRGRKRRQQQKQLAVGETWKETGFVLTQPDGDRLHPQHVSEMVSGHAFAQVSAMIKAHLAGFEPATVGLEERSFAVRRCQPVSVCPVLVDFGVSP
jgi:hypothetical protein